MRSLAFVLGVLSVSLLAQGASATPLDVTYTVHGDVASSSGVGGSGVPFAGTITLRIPGGDPTVGGSLDYAGTLSVVSGSITATGAPLQLMSGPSTSIFVTTIVWPAAPSFPYGSSFVAFQVPGFEAFGNVVPGSFVLDMTVRYPWTVGTGSDFATGSIFGTEVSRQLVPEPTVALLLALGATIATLRTRHGRS